MNYRFFTFSLALGLMLCLANIRAGQAQTGNASDVTGFNLTTSSLIPIGSAISRSSTWNSGAVQQTVNNSVASVADGSYAVQDVVVSGSGESVEIDQVTLINPAGQTETISFTNGDLISNLISSQSASSFEAPNFSPDDNGQIAISQITSLPDNTLNSTIKSFLNTDATSLDSTIVELSTELAVALQSIQADGNVSPSNIATAIDSFSTLIETAQSEGSLQQLGDGVYGAYAALSFIVNSATAAAE